MDVGKLKGRHSTLFVLMLIITVVVVASSALYTVFLVRCRTDDLIARADDKLLVAAEFARELLGPGYHDRIVDETSVSKEEYLRIVARNDDLCRRLNLQYLWSVLQVDNRLVFTSATHFDLSNPDSPCASFFESHGDPKSFASALPPHGKSSFSSFKNEWGQGRQVLVPRRDARGRTYIFGASVQLTELNTVLRRTILTSCGISLAVIAGTFLLALVLVRAYTAPVARLTEAAERMARGDLDVPLTPAGTREMHSLARSLDRMRRGLQRNLEEVRQSGEKFKAIANYTVDWEFWFGPDGKCLWVSPSVKNITGYSAEEALAMPDIISALVPEEDQAQVQMRFQEALQGVRGEDFEFRYLHRDGSKRWLSASWQPIFDDKGQSLGFRASGRDVTRRRLIEEALRESEEKYRSLASTADSMYLVDRDCRFLLVNDRHLARFGMTAEQVIGRRHSEFHGDEDAVLFENYVREVFETGESRQDEYLSARDGRYFVRTLSPVKDKHGKTSAVTVAAKDITERKQAEEKRVLLEERLQRSEKMEALGLLAGGVAHDLNNVLGIIVGYAELLLCDVAESSPMKNRLRQILTGGERAAAIVQDLLTLARRGVPARQVINLNRIVVEHQQSPEFERLSARYPAVRIAVDLEPDLLNLSGSPVHLGKTLFNLVANACEAMPGGGIVTIRTANQYIDKPVRGYDEVREGDYVVLSVSDTGEGIEAADLKRIFEPFYTKKVMGRSGTGLGLAVVWGTVKDHCGYIDVQSREGKGSVFTLYFPVTQENLSTEPVSPSLGEYMGREESILVIDDVEGQREMAAAMLRKLNYIVATASGGEEALAYLGEHRADLLVLDMIMDPGMDGLSTYKAVLAIRPGQKAVIVSGFSESDRVHEAQALGAGAYVKKPYIMEKLGLAVRKELDRSEAKAGTIDEPA